MRVLLLFLAALTCRCGRAGSDAARQAPAAPAAARRRRPAPPPPARPSADSPFRRPRTLPPAGSGPVVYQVVPCFEKQGGFPVVEANTYLYYIEMKSRLSNSQTGKWVPYDDAIEQVDSRGLQAAVGDELPRRPRDQDRGLHLLQRRHRQDGRLRHGGAAAGQDRRLRRPEEGRPVEDRREAEREEHHDPARLVHRSGAHPPRHRRRARALRRRRVISSPRSSPRSRTSRAGPKLVHVTFHVTEGPKVKIDEIDFVGNKAISDGKLGQQDEGEQAARASSASSPAAAPTRKTSSPRTRSSSPISTATRVTSWPRSASRR